MEPPPAPDWDLDPLAAELLVRSVFPDTTREQACAALDASAPGRELQLIERASSILQTPFVIVDGELDTGAFLDVARRLRRQAVQVEVGARSGFTWTEVAADGSYQTGTGQGALPLATVLGSVAQLLDEPVAAIR